MVTPDKAPCGREPLATCQWRNNTTLMCGMRMGRCVPPRTFGQSKYGNKRVVIDGITFDSTLEGNRYTVLNTLARAGEVLHFECQVPYAYVGKSGKVLFKYIADFVVDWKGGRRTVEDTKGFLTPVYRLKKKLVEDHFGITITEVYAKGHKKPRRRKKSNATG